MILVVIYFELLYVLVLDILIGISRPNLDPVGHYCSRHCTDGWFMDAVDGALWGNGKENDDGVADGGFEQGDRVGVLLDLGDGSFRFFKNGARFRRSGKLIEKEIPKVIQNT